MKCSIAPLSRLVFILSLILALVQVQGAYRAKKKPSKRGVTTELRGAQWRDKNTKLYASQDGTIEWHVSDSQKASNYWVVNEPYPLMTLHPPQVGKQDLLVTIRWTEPTHTMDGAAEGTEVVETIYSTVSGYINVRYPGSSSEAVKDRLILQVKN